MDADEIARLRIALARISRFVDRQVSGDGMTRTQLSVLASTARWGPIGLSNLAELEGVNPTMLSRIVGKLEAAGLLSRLPDPDDHRAVRVEVTPEGRALQDRLRGERTRLFAEHVDTLPPERAEELATALPIIELLAEGMRRRPPAGARRVSSGR